MINTKKRMINTHNIAKYQLFTITELPMMQQIVILGDFPNP
jgi:hypothetical protein